MQNSQNTILSDYQEKLAETFEHINYLIDNDKICLLYTSPSPRDGLLSRMPSSA